MLRMERTTVMAEERVLHRLRALAKSRGVSFGELVREALEEKLEREQPALGFLGTVRRGSAAPSARAADEGDLYRPDPSRSARR